MYIIIDAWLAACRLFYPSTFINLIKSSLFVFGRSFVQFMSNFGWLFIIDALFFVLIGDVLTRATLLQSSSGKGLDPAIIIIMLLNSVIWFLASTAFFLLIRKNDILHPKLYFKAYFFRYMQLLLFSSFTMLISLYALLVAGITKIPTAPWIMLVGIKLTESCVSFYWLDSRGFFIDLLRSFEKAVNLIFYNMPFLGFILIFILVLDYGTGSFASWALNRQISHLFFALSTSLQQGKEVWTISTTCKILLLKYSVFLLENLLLSILFVVYRRKKHDQYTTSVFEIAKQ